MFTILRELEQNQCLFFDYNVIEMFVYKTVNKKKVRMKDGGEQP